MSVQRTDVAEIQRRLLDWYAANRRQLPWRDLRDSYAIVVSEFMLQQTGVDRVRPFYERFLVQFPTFASLASAPRVEVLRAWAGLGYNRRAVNLHRLAQSVVAEFGGELPRDAEALRRLPGVGPYTAAAILSFVYHQDVATLDTNVRRVIRRLRFGGATPTESQLAQGAQELVPPGWSSPWNQALMDFGSLQCTVTTPACLLCPLVDLCAAAPISSVLPAERKVAEQAEPYLGSRRFLRGRMVARLRELPSGEYLSLENLATSVGLDPAAIRLVAELARALAGDGLAQIRESPSGTVVGPPE